MQKMSHQQARTVNGGFSLKSLFNPLSSGSLATSMAKAVTSAGVGVVQRLSSVF
jgi:hypothetical protein